MNRKQRRAALKQSPPAGPGVRLAPADPVRQLFATAVQHQQKNELAEAARLYKRLLLLKPDHAEACNNLGCVLLAQGKLHEASERFARSLALMPQLFAQFNGICATLVAVLPPIGEAIRKANAAWPECPTAEHLLGHGGLATIAGDPLLACLLHSVTVRDVALERLLTALRASLLHAAASGPSSNETELTLCCSIARQCFINEYVFATTPAEDAQVERLEAALRPGAPAPLAVAAVAMYRPLHTLPAAPALLEQSWPPAVDAVLTQQLREPLQERELRASIPRLTAIDDGVSQRVREQYEENPYPRWVDVAGGVEPVALDQYLRAMFPGAVLTPLADRAPIEVLVAGCGTGYHAIGTAQKYRDTQVLAVDLSLGSLAYAKRKTPASLAGRLS